MFEEVRNTALGLTIALSAMGLTARAQEGEQSEPSENRAVAAEMANFNEMQGLESGLISRDLPSGALHGAKLPVLDGPVKWGYPDERLVVIALGAMGALAGAAAGFGVALRMEDRGLDGFKGFVSSMFLGTALGVGAGVGLTEPPLVVVEFDTTVAEVIDGSPSHYERSGKSDIGPLFGQVVMIPELPIPLAVDVKDAPFLPGQNIKARVALDAEGHIVGWQASAGLRPE